MSDNRAISPPAHYYTRCLREEYVAICQGNTCAAMILSQMEYWYTVKRDHAEQAKHLNTAATRNGEEGTQDTGLWVYKSHPEMKAELFGQYGDKAIADGYKYLLDRGFLLTRANPKYQWDKTKQYLFNVTAVQSAVDELPRRTVSTGETAELPTSKAQNCGTGGAEMRDRSGKPADSIAQSRAMNPKNTSYGTLRKQTKSQEGSASPSPEEEPNAAHTDPSPVIEADAVEDAASVSAAVKASLAQSATWEDLDEAARQPWMDQARAELREAYKASGLDVDGDAAVLVSSRAVSTRARTLYDTSRVRVD